MCRLSDPVGWLCVRWGVRSTTNFVGVGLGRVDGQVIEWVWAAWGLFGDENIHSFHKHGNLISEQSPGSPNPLYDLAIHPAKPHTDKVSCATYSPMDT